MKIFEILTIYKKINGILRLQSYNDSDGFFFSSFSKRYFERFDAIFQMKNSS